MITLQTTDYNGDTLEFDIEEYRYNYSICSMKPDEDLTNLIQICDKLRFALSVFIDEESDIEGMNRLIGDDVTALEQETISLLRNICE